MRPAGYCPPHLAGHRVPRANTPPPLVRPTSPQSQHTLNPELAPSTRAPKVSMTREFVPEAALRDTMGMMSRRLADLLHSMVPDEEARAELLELDTAGMVGSLCHWLLLGAFGAPALSAPLREARRRSLGR